jgi:hypothetical protein
LLPDALRASGLVGQLADALDLAIDLLGELERVEAMAQP